MKNSIYFFFFLKLIDLKLLIDLICELTSVLVFLGLFTDNQMHQKLGNEVMIKRSFRYLLYQSSAGHQINDTKNTINHVHVL